MSVNRRPVLKPIIDDTPFKPIPVDNNPAPAPPLKKESTTKKANVNLFSQLKIEYKYNI